MYEKMSRGGVNKNKAVWSGDQAALKGFGRQRWTPCRSRYMVRVLPF